MVFLDKGRVDVIVNPYARGVPEPRRIKAACDALLREGWDVHPWYTETKGDSTRLARAAHDARSKVVIACGGDGTLNEVVQSLAGSSTALSVIPAGTANVWANESGFPRDPVKAALAIQTAEVVPADLGVANGRYFLLMGSLGFDALVAATVNPKLKKRVGAIAYAVQAAAEVRKLKRLKLDLRMDGRHTELEAMMVVIGNTRLYGGVLEITRNAIADDGFLDVCALDAEGVVDALRILYRVRRGKHVAARGVFYQRALEIEVVTPGIPVQIDGESFGETPTTFRVARGAARLVVPAGKANALFTRPEHRPA